uniref:Retrovirus-related Pol polyprotein from transposon TNT 1-94-like beta-barrel domain-containing protein n=1 Tax=Tanacetum cinerariifolium TaxID=118510 RepID=A0A6L2M1S0_TANCI|nr:hypothetical protein [Tanacetum cinerariifolium]
MLEKDMYDYWKSIMELYMMNTQHGRMILESVKNGPLIWPSTEENGVTRPKKYSELSATKAIQADCDVKATNIILQVIPPEVYALVSNHKVAKELWERIQLLMQGTSLTKQEREWRHTSLVAGTSRTYTSGASGNNYGKQRTVICYNCKGEGYMSKQCTKTKRKRYEPWFKDKVLLVQAQANGQILHEEELAFLADLKIAEAQTTQTVITHNVVYQADDLDAYDSYCNEINTSKAMLLSEQSNIVNQSETEITSDSNIIPYPQYMTNAIVIRDSEETLMLAEESRSKMLLKQKDPMMSENKVNTKPVDYANSVNFEEPTPSTRPTQDEVSKELPKVSMVNTSLKKLKHHLSSFDVVVKERTTTIAITEGTWEFKHTKACFRDEIIPFVKAIKDLLNSFDQFLIDELFEVQNAFHQMKQAVEQHRVESKTFQVKMNKLLNKNERLLEQAISKDVVNIVVTSTMNNAYELLHECERCVKLETVLQKDFIKREIYDKLFKRYTTLEKHCISLEVDTQLNREIFKETTRFHNKVVQIVLWHLDSGCSKHMTEDRSQLTNFVDKILGTVKFGNDHMGKIMGYGDYQIGNVTVSKVYFVDGLGHKLFSVGHFRDSDLEVAFRQHTYFIRRCRSVVWISRKQSIYPVSWRYDELDNILFWVPKLKFEKDYLCSACAMGKSKKKSHKPKSEDTNQEKLYLLHMDLCGPMCVESVNEKKYILVIVDDYSRFTWVKCLRRIIKTIHVDFDELTAMASEQSSSRPALHEMTPATISSGLVPNLTYSTPFVPPSRIDWDLLFQSLFDELLTPLPSVDHPALEVIAPITEVVAPKPVASTGLPFSTTFDQDAPSPSKTQTTPETQPPIIPNDVEEDNHDIEVAYMRNDPFFGIPIPEVSSDQSSLTDSIHTIVHFDHQISEGVASHAVEGRPLIVTWVEGSAPCDGMLGTHQPSPWTYGMATDYGIIKEEMSKLSGRESVPGIISREKGKMEGKDYSVFT